MATALNIPPSSPQFPTGAQVSATPTALYGRLPHWYPRLLNNNITTMVGYTRNFGRHYFVALSHYHTLRRKRTCRPNSPLANAGPSDLPSPCNFHVAKLKSNPRSSTTAPLLGHTLPARSVSHPSFTFVSPTGGYPRGSGKAPLTLSSWSRSNYCICAYLGEGARREASIIVAVRFCRYPKNANLFNIFPNLGLS